MAKPSPARLLNKWLVSDGLEVDRELTRKRRKIGWVVTLLASSHQMLVIPVRHRDSFKAGEKTITDARKGGVESWPVDSELLLSVKNKPPTYVLLFDTDTGDQWLSHYRDWFDRDLRGKAPNTGRYSRSIFLKTCHMQHRQADCVLTAIKR